VSFHQFGEGGLGSARRVFAEQLLIAAFVHFTGIAAAGS
jgi:hypothetical protein